MQQAARLAHAAIQVPVWKRDVVAVVAIVAHVCGGGDGGGDVALLDTSPGRRWFAALRSSSPLSSSLVLLVVVVVAAAEKDGPAHSFHDERERTVTVLERHSLHADEDAGGIQSV